MNRNAKPSPPRRRVSPRHALSVGLLVLFSALPAATTAGASTLEAIRSLGIPMQHHGSVAVFDQGADGEAARQLAAMLERASRFFAGEVGSEVPTALALLEEAAWGRVAQVPYGMPFVSGPPYVVVLPATRDHALSELLDDALAGSGVAQRHGIAPRALVDRFVSLVAFHELGHVHARESGIPHPEKWIFEFNATYLAYAFLRAERPEWARLWVDACDTVAGRLQPEHRSLDDFEALYVAVGFESYTWYQCVFLSRAAEVFEAQGLDFVRALNEGPPPQASTTHHLAWLEARQPGFLAWGRRHGLMPPG